jgi:hypothetical protein
MLVMFRDGGFPMYFILGFGLVSLGWAAVYAAQGKRKALGFVHSMMAATFFVILSAVMVDMGMVFKTLAGSDDVGEARHAMAADVAHRTEILLEGLGESMAPGVMGFSLLGLTALLLAVGASRVAKAEGV